MRIGIPREIKDGEHRVALTPTAVRQLTNVVVEPGAGAGVGFTDAQYLAAGATLGDAWECELVVKVKELQEPEYRKPRRGQTIFAFQHFAPQPSLLAAALETGATFIAFETVGQGSGLPVLVVMVRHSRVIPPNAFILTISSASKPWGTRVAPSAPDAAPRARVSSIAADILPVRR